MNGRISRPIDNLRGLDFISRNASLCHTRYTESRFSVQVAYSMAIEWTNLKARHGHVYGGCDAYATHKLELWGMEATAILHCRSRVLESVE